jgi:hypothetical protein
MQRALESCLSFAKPETPAPVATKPALSFLDQIKAGKLKSSNSSEPAGN